MPENILKNMRLLSLTDRTLISDYFRSYPPRISEFTFTNLFAWRLSRPIWLSETNGTLVFCISGNKHRQTPDIMFGPPVGPGDLLETVKSLRSSINAAERLPAVFADRLEQEGFVVTLDRDNADYVYRVSDLAELAGRKYAKKRNHIKQCLAENSCTYVEINAGLIGECLQMQDRWCHMRECAKDPGLCGELTAIRETLTHFEEFGLLGGAIRIQGEIMAFAIGEKLHDNTAVWHFEKAMPGFNGLGQLINTWFAQYGLKDFEYVNREQDLGIPGLRLAKESYYPHSMVEKIKVCFSESSESTGTAAACF